MIDNKEAGCLVLVKQVRIPVLCNDSSKDGIVVEACAGLVDKDKSIEEIAREEVLEECGFDVNINDVRFVKTLKSSVGTAGTNAHLFFVDVDNSCKVSDGGGIDGEDIEIFELPYEDVTEFIFTSNHYDSDAVTHFFLSAWMNIMLSQ